MGSLVGPMDMMDVATLRQHLQHVTQGLVPVSGFVAPPGLAREGNMKVKVLRPSGPSSTTGRHDAHRSVDAVSADLGDDALCSD